jgi:hypothetical protein
MIFVELPGSWRPGDGQRWADLEQWQQARQFGLSLSSLSHKTRSGQAGTDQAQTSHRAWLLINEEAVKSSSQGTCGG